MKFLVSALLTFVFVTSCSSFEENSQSGSNSINDARQAFSRMEHAKAYGIFQNVWNDQNQTLQDRKDAGLFIAKMDWLLYDKSQKAKKALLKLEELNHEIGTVLILRARILAAEGKFNEAIELADRAIQLSNSETTKYNAEVAYATHVLSSLKQMVFAGQEESETDNQQKKRAFGLLEALSAENIGDVEIVKLQLGYALLLRDGEVAFAAFMQYYGFTNLDQIHASLLTSPAQFENSLKSYRPDSDNLGVVEVIIKGLAESGFYEYAALLKAHEFGLASHADRRINKIYHYQNFLSRVKTISKDFYRATLKGKSSITDFKKEYYKLAETFWDESNLGGGKATFSTTLFDQTIREQFKAITVFMKSNGFYGLHMGGVVLDDRRTISQYDKSAEFRYLQVDHMLSNGYTSWFSDGESEVGGWATNDGSFLQVRAGLNQALIMIWTFLTDPVENKKVLDNVERMSKLEDDISGKDPYAFLQSLKLRILIGESQRMLDSLKSTGLEKKYLRFTFINQMQDISQGAKIFAHEGRHSIDMKYGYSNSSKQLEFTAKLSEIYFSKMPRFFAATIFDANLGDGTPHGEANLRLIKGLVDWMDNHKGEIKGFDSARPTFPQFDQLTDQQVRTVVRSLDPMAN